PGAATDPVTHQRFGAAVEVARTRTGPGDPRITWWDTTTLSPWAATYDDPDHRGADLIGGIYDPGSVPRPPAPEEPAGGAARRQAAHASKPSFVRLPLLVAACAGVALLLLAAGISGVVVRDDESADPSPAVT